MRTDRSMAAPSGLKDRGVVALLSRAATIVESFRRSIHVHQRPLLCRGPSAILETQYARHGYSSPTAAQPNANYWSRLANAEPQVRLGILNSSRLRLQRRATSPAVARRTLLRIPSHTETG